MGEPEVKQATYGDLLQVPEHLTAEILDGELHAQRRPAPPSAKAYAFSLRNWQKTVRPARHREWRPWRMVDCGYWTPPNCT